MYRTKWRREQERGRGRGRKERERGRGREGQGRGREREREEQEGQGGAPEQGQEQERRQEQHTATRIQSIISPWCTCLRSGRYQSRQRNSATPPGAPLGSKLTTSITTPGHGVRQELPQPTHTDGDTLRLRLPIGPSLASPRDCRDDGTHGPGENALRPSGSGAMLYPPERPAPTSLPLPHRPPKVERPSPHPRTIITNPNQAESQTTWQTSDLDNNLMVRVGDQSVREYNSTTFLSHMDLDFPDPNLKLALIRTNQRTV